jgi:hypothetical protein
MRTRLHNRLIALAAMGLFLAYVTSYVVATRIRYEQFREWHAPGFWYVSWDDETSQSWERKEQVAAVLYGPLNYIECDVFGFGMAHAGCSPFFTLVK